MPSSTTANDTSATGAELRGAGLLFVIGGLYAIVVLGAELSPAATIAGALIGAGIAAVDVQALSEYGRDGYAVVFVVVLGAILGIQWIISYHAPWIEPYLGSITLGVGGAGLLAGIALWARERELVGL